MFYHASQIEGITTLEPRVSNHDILLVYFSTKRENVLVYLSNAIEKYCKDSGFIYDGKWHKWGPYGFNEDGRLRLEEYYPNALINTYKGVSGYIYSAKDVKDSGYNLQIPDAISSSEEVNVINVEYIPDAYEAILQAEKDGLITVLRYEDLSEKRKNRIIEIIKEEYEKSTNQSDYRHFLIGNFPDILKNE
ncbi:hypothetical protein [uncultured Solobacterium sp.]|uniref:hypothetical protein n=1 Tax=uncultured Solobacterium sp. TaxID=747375 RepID=UPI0028E3BBE7|nr:hypothetical protein [uncultured Solobacterium sp.]